jgi:hypothetical protein
MSAKSAAIILIPFALWRLRNTVLIQDRLFLPFVILLPLVL